MVNRSTLESAAIVVLAVCAVIVTGLVARRELGGGPGAKPKPVKVEDWRTYDVGGDAIGPAEAPIRVVVFSDFQCPFCRRLAFSMDSMLTRHADRVHVTFRHFPLTQIHPQARPAAIAASCAGRQGRFKAFHDLAFAMQDSLGAIPWTRLAADAGIRDTVGFATCLADPATLERLAVDSTAADRLQLGGTPTVIVNGWRYPGTPSAANLDELIGRKAVR